jgi:hypothetical protein
MSPTQPPFNLNEYKYETDGYYSAFKADVDEKICAAMVSESLARHLKKEQLVYNTDQPVPVADIGCGPADSIQMYLAGADHKGGFHIHATDSNQGYTGSAGKAHQNLQIGKSGGKLKIQSFSVTNGDAFDGKLNETIGKDPNHFPLTFMSHMIYHTKPENVQDYLPRGNLEIQVDRVP